MRKRSLIGRLRRSKRLRLGSDDQELASNEIGLNESQPGSDRQALSLSMEKISRDADPQSSTVPLSLVGTFQDQNKADKLMEGGFAEANAGGSPSVIATGFEQLEKNLPNEKLIQPSPSDGEQTEEWIIRIAGDKELLETAKEMLREVINQANAGGSPPLVACGLNAGQAATCFEQLQKNLPNEKDTYKKMMMRASARFETTFLSRGYSPQQQGHCPRRPVAPQSGTRGGSHYSQFFGYDYPQRAHGPLSQGNYNYVQHPGPKYGHHPQHEGPQPTPYAQGGPTTHSGYGPPKDQYSHAQPFGQQPRPKPNQPVEAGKQGPAQTHGQSSPSSQQQYPYATSAPMQQTYPNPPHGSAPAAASSGYGQSVAGYGQQPPQAGSTRGYAEQQLPPQRGPPAAAYPVAAAYAAQPTQAHQPGFYQSGGVAAAEPVVGAQQQRIFI